MQYQSFFPCQHLQILCAGNFLGAKAGEVVGVCLAINPRKAVVEHDAGKMRKRALARIGHASEHRFTEKARTDGDAIKAPDRQ